MPESTTYLQCEVENNVLVLTVTRRQIEGEDIAAVLKAELLQAVQQYDRQMVVLDLKNTRYVSSIAFWPLLALKKYLAEKGGRLLLCGLTGPVQEIFNTTKMVSGSGSLNAPFDTAPDRQSAIARLSDPDQTSAWHPPPELKRP
jgi:anti-anti-sigma factor